MVPYMRANSHTTDDGDIFVIGVLIVDAFCVLYLQTRMLGIDNIGWYISLNTKILSFAPRHKDIKKFSKERTPSKKRVHRFMNNTGSCLSEREKNDTILLLPSTL